ncbi:hypothetical protein GCM10011380_30310 [Sphingomonas metalli]|uniref:Ferritin-like domain-containing protein n=1 Tax=Sphingomonas metalli TaxID=1779358 RepID=A0A916WY53_9SPHN|nr:ferritin-like domain-containing protein [Sphingomonas metalli]GGB38810.1 hypothetical protein GCM10011380_30310 [Sphingomonas metalli]
MTDMIDTTGTADTTDADATIHPLRAAADRRRFLRLCGQGGAIAGGAMLLDACGGGDDDSTASPSPTPTPTASPTAPPVPTPVPTYTATDADRLNFLLQVDYLFAALMLRGVLDQSLPASLTGGAGAQGSVTGGRALSFQDQILAELLRETAYDLVTQITALRGLIGSAVTAQPAITIAGTVDGPFTKLAPTTVVKAGDAFDPYASEELFLMQATAIGAITVTAYHDVARQMSNRDLMAKVSALMAARSYQDGMLRYYLYWRGALNNSLYDTIFKLSDARDAYDGNRDYDKGVGNQYGADILPGDANQGVFRRTPEQVLNILYISKTPVAAGGFFPAGVNGLIKTSGSSQT